MSDFKFNCPHCKQSLEAPKELFGETIECPQCNGSIQLPAPQSKPQSSREKVISQDSSVALACPRCGKANVPGELRCQKCGKRLSPRILAIATALGAIAFTGITVVSLVSAEKAPISGLSIACISIAGLWFVLSLRRGAYWAWIGIQIVFGLLSCNIMIAPFIAEGSQELRSAVIPMIGTLLFFGSCWGYLYLPKVRRFCSQGKSS